MRRTMLVALLWAVWPVLHAATWQVGPTRAYLTLDQLLDAEDLEPGDLVEIDGDVVYPGGVIIEAADGGSPGNPVTFRGIRVNGQRPHFFGGANNTLENQANHVVFESFEISGEGDPDTGTRRCFFHHSHDVVLRDFHVHDCPRQGILGADQDSGSLTIEYSEVTNIGGDSRDHAIYMATDEVAYPGAVFRLQYSYVHDSHFDANDDGGNLIKSRAERNEIYYNWLEGAYYHELELIGPDPFGAQGGWSEGLAREDSDIVGNVILHTEPFGAILRFGGDATGQSFGRYRFVNNTVIRTGAGSATVFRLFDGIGALEAHNNVLWNAGPDALRVIREVEAIWAGGASNITGSRNWIETGSSFVPDSFAETVFGTDPGFEDFALLNLTPALGSPLLEMAAGSTSTGGYDLANPLFPPTREPPVQMLIDVGTAAMRPVNGILDIGAFERPNDDILFRNGFELQAPEQQPGNEVHGNP